MRGPFRSPHFANSRLAVAVYAAAWLAAAAVIAVFAVVLLDSLGGDDEVTLPPLRETKLADAARDAGCELRHADAGERLNPPVDGAAAAVPAAAGFYEHPVSTPSLIAALRRGVVVIQVAPNLDDEDAGLVRTIQETVPEGTIVAPNASGMSYTVAITAYRRLLGCRALNERTLDAVRLFRGRFVGRGPDS
jgi:hypothetical protein